MNFAIISAGEGSRLAQEGVAKPKPLVELNGEAMIERLIRIFMRQGADRVVVIINDLVPETRDFLIRLKEDLPIELVVKTTPSSMHSFFEISHLLEGDRFCLTTVDTIFHEEEFARYIEAFRASEADGLMAVTDYVDDEKPLYISTDEELRITGFHDEAPAGGKYISGGIYCLTPLALKTLQRCMDEGRSRMRNFQRQLVADGLCLKAWPFSKIVDVDHAEDIAKAEEFLSPSEAPSNSPEGGESKAVVSGE